jgi:hypothetical protein
MRWHHARRRSPGRSGEGLGRRERANGGRHPAVGNPLASASISDVASGSAHAPAVCIVYESGLEKNELVDRIERAGLGRLTLEFVDARPAAPRLAQRLVTPLRSLRRRGRQAIGVAVPGTQKSAWILTGVLMLLFTPFFVMTRHPRRTSLRVPAQVSPSG